MTTLTALLDSVMWFPGTDAVRPPRAIAAALEAAGVLGPDHDCFWNGRMRPAAGPPPDLDSLRLDLTPEEAAAFEDAIAEKPPAPDAARLDVDRLAQALFETQRDRLHGGVDGLGLGSHEADAAVIAERYAALAAEDRLDGVARIARERRRQIEVERYDAAHDTGQDEKLAMAAAAYAWAYGLELMGWTRELLWPWDEEHWKPSPDDRIRELEKAGALIAAAIDAILDRAEGETR